MKKTSRSTEPLEANIVTSICTALKYRGMVFKVHGGPYQESGFPDILFWAGGHAFAFEIKRPIESYKVTALQLRTLEDLAKEGVHAAVAHSVTEVLDFVNEVLSSQPRNLPCTVRFCGEGVNGLDEDVTDRYIGK